MITELAKEQAVQAVDEMDTSGLRRICMCCKRDLPNSNLTATRTSHGLCSPPCQSAITLGWGEAVKLITRPL
jgi:hypothetical protein